MADEKIVKTDNQPERARSPLRTERMPSPAKKKRPGLGKRIAKYFRDLRGEFKKIIWPTFPRCCATRRVLAMCAIMGLVICVIDFGLGAWWISWCRWANPSAACWQGGVEDGRGSEMVCGAIPIPAMRTRSPRTWKNCGKPEAPRLIHEIASPPRPLPRSRTTKTRGGTQNFPRLRAGENGDDRRFLVCGAQHPRLHRLCGPQWEAHPSDGGRGRRPGRRKARDRGQL